MKSIAQVFGRSTLRPSRRVCRGLWKRLEDALRRRVEAGSGSQAQNRRGP
jgi:hypothetical protein